MGVGVTPADLFGGQTPHQLAALFLDAAGNVTEDKLAVLASENAKLGRVGRPPFVPSWLAAKLNPVEGV